MTPPQALHPDAAPARERHDLIDALRGFALGGVLMVNLASFSLYEFMPDPARATLPTARFDAIALEAMELLVNIKFITLFSLLFGLGFSLQMERAQASGGLARFVRRLLVLLAIGLLHGFFVWWGDILLTYAVVGLALLGFRHASDRTLLVAGLALALLLPPMLSPWMRELLAGWPKQDMAYAGAWQAFASPSLGTVMRANLDLATWARVSNWALLFFVMGRFLLGYWAGRRGLFQRPSEHAALLTRLFRGGLMLGIAITVLQFTQADLREQIPLLDGAVGKFCIRVLLRAGPLALGIAYAAGFALLFLRPGWHRPLLWLAPMGRMALTHYLAQSVLGIAVFYAIGLGIGPRWGVAGWLAAWAVIYVAQAASSHWWLARFRFGPMEWLWRSLTYARWQPMRR